MWGNNSTSCKVTEYVILVYTSEDEFKNITLGIQVVKLDEEERTSFTVWAELFEIPLMLGSRLT